MTHHFYKLEDRELMQMLLESLLNLRIAMFLVAHLLGRGVPPSRVYVKLEVAVPSKNINVRCPDLTVFSEELYNPTKEIKRSLITLDMPAPSLVVEVVSPNQSKRDYETKRSEYFARRIPEYWIVNPILKKITVFNWSPDFYEERVFMEEDVVMSNFLGKFELKAAQILTGGEK